MTKTVFPGGWLICKDNRLMIAQMAHLMWVKDWKKTQIEAKPWDTKIDFRIQHLLITSWDTYYQLVRSAGCGKTTNIIRLLESDELFVKTLKPLNPKRKMTHSAEEATA